MKSSSPSSSTKTVQTPLSDSQSESEPMDQEMPMSHLTEEGGPNALNELGEKIFLDRYALKDMTKSSLRAGDHVVVCIDLKTGQREIGKVKKISGDQVTVQLRDGAILERATENIDKPLELTPEEMMDRVARGISHNEGAKSEEWREKFRWLLDGWKFIPGGRILTAAGSDQQLTYYNCYVVPSPRDSRRGIVETLSQMMEIMSRGGGVGINVSSLRPKHAYVKGVNGRSSGSVSWGALYSFVTGLIEQGGCLTPDSLVFTEKGLLRMDEIVLHGEKGWRDHSLSVMTDEGVRSSRQAYNNGISETLTVRTDMGLTLAGTPNHKVKVMTSHGPEWRPIGQLQTGDSLIVKLGQHRGERQSLQHPTLTHHNQDPVRLPETLDEDLAFFLGYFMGDGFMTVKENDWRLGVSVAHSSYLMDEMPRLMERLFGGLNVRQQQKDEDASVTLIASNRMVKEFLRLNDLDKPASAEVRVPRLIRQSPPEVVGAFLQGLFEADGAVSHGYPALTSISKRLIDEAATLLIGLGCPVRIDIAPLGKDSFGVQTKWRLRIHSFRGLENWKARIGCDPRSRFAACLNFEPDLTRETSYVLPDASYWVDPVLTATILPQIDRKATGERFKASDQKLRKSLLRYQRGDRNLTLSAYATLCEEHPEFLKNAPPVNDLWFVSVDSVRPSGLSPTLDLEVDENHTYLANGLVTHNSRRGALMLILNCWHPDVMEFIGSKREMGRITNANISVGVTDDFMEAVKNDGDWPLVFPDTSDSDFESLWDGDLNKWKSFGKQVITHKTVKAREIWNSIIESAWASAEPGVFFVDRYNKMSNSWYYAPILCTNPCVTGDTLIYTSKGLRTAKELYERGGEIDAVIDGRFGYLQNASHASNVFRTGRKKVYRLTTREGYSLRATSDHRVMTPSGWRELRDLQPGDAIHILNRKGGFGEEGSLALGRTLGWLAGDGTLKEKEAVLSFFGDEKRELAPMFAGYVNEFVEPLTANARRYEISPVQIADRDEARIGSTRLRALVSSCGLTESKLQMPECVLRGSEDMQRGYLQALFTADGSFQDGGPKGGSARLAGNHLELLENVQRLLLNFGIASRIYRNRRDAGYREMPNSQRELQAYWCEAQHELAITKRNLIVFAREIGFLMSYKQEKLESYVTRGSRGPYSERFAATVEDVLEEGEEDVYDLSEPVTHSFIANGFVVHNCGEQGLPGWGVCNLGALNLGKFVTGDRVGTGAVDWETLGTAIRYAVRFLDNVIDSTPYFFDENRRQQINERRVGLGVMGLADMMIRLGIRYGGSESVAFLDKLFGFIAAEAYKASADIAAEKGAFPKFDADKFLQSGFMRNMPEEVRERIREKGCRNVTLLTVAPTGTTGTMVGTSTGVEPFFSWSYYRKSRLGMHEENVAVLKEWKEQNGEEAPLPPYFSASMDLTPEEHVRAQAAAQRWIDSSISKTCNVPNSYTMEQTRELYELMYELGCKGGTIYRDGSRSEQVLNLKEEKKPEPAAPEKPAEKVRPRPYKRYGVTVSQPSPSGTAHITMNDDADGRPFEVFVDIGKGGSDIKAMAEAMGRLMSLLLRITSPLSPRERIEEIVNQIKGIGGARSLGFGRHRVRSLPDAVAQALEEHYSVEGDGNGGVPHSHEPDEEEPETMAEAVAKLNGDGKKRVSADICPECGIATFVRKEGCHTCESCGYSEC